MRDLLLDREPKDYDVATDALVDTIPVPCPMMDVASLGADGYLYVSGWSYMPLSAEAGLSPKNCAARIDPVRDRIVEGPGQVPARSRLQLEDRRRP